MTHKNNWSTFTHNERTMLHIKIYFNFMIRNCILIVCVSCCIHHQRWSDAFQMRNQSPKMEWYIEKEDEKKLIYGQFQITAGKIYCLNQDQFKLNGEQLNSRNIIRNNTIRTTGAVSGIAAAAAAVASGTFKRIIIYFISFSSSDVIPHEPEHSIDERAGCREALRRVQWLSCKRAHIAHYALPFFSSSPSFCC